MPLRPNTRPNFTVVTPLPIPLPTASTLHPERWLSLLARYPDAEFPALLANIAMFGARVGYLGPYVRIRGHNHRSAYRISTDITQNIANELAAGRIAQLSSLPTAYYISPLGAVEKKQNGKRTGWRRIHDLSHPFGRSVNDGIPQKFGTLQYQTFDDAIRLIASAGQFATLRKRDIKDAFRTVPVSPYDYWLLIFEWQGALYVDIYLPFGLRTSPFIFNLFAEGLHWILEHVFQWQLIHYLDDFLLINDPDPEFFGSLAAFLGFLENQSKREDGFLVNFLGLEIDTAAMKARLPPDKHARALKAVKSLLHRGRISYRTLEKLLGFLSFCTRILPLGRPFLHNLFTFLTRLSQLHPHAVARINAPAKRELQWWLTFLPRWSGIQVISSTPRTHIHLYTDASSLKGIGGWWSTFAFSARLPRFRRKKHIDWREAYAILFAFAQWSSHWHDAFVEIHCDNSAIVDAINSKSIRGPAINILQMLFLLASLDNIALKATWLSSQDNWIADALSRFEFSKLANIFPQLHARSRRHQRHGNPMLALRARLQTSFGTLLPPVPAHNIKPVLTATPNSAYFMPDPPGQLALSPSHPG